MADASSRYRLAGLIKAGGMAEVHEAYVHGDSGFERKVAIKRLLPSLGEEDFVRGFMDEARIASQLHHANIASVFDFGVLDERPFLVMELIDGLDVASLVEKANDRGRSLPPEIALHVAAEVAHALDYAHRATDAHGRGMGIIHRDVSPQNVLLSWEGDVKLVDFGIARAMNRLNATRIGVAKGKVSFMSPEQLKAADIDGRADIYSLGCVIHWMLTGRSAVRRDQGADGLWTLGKIEIERSLPEDVASIISRATRSSRDERYPRASEMAQACGAALIKRLQRDGRSTLRDFVSPYRPEIAQPKRPGLGDLIEVEMVLMGGSGPVRRFESVIAGPGGAVPLDDVPDLAPAESSAEGEGELPTTYDRGLAGVTEVGDRMAPPTVAVVLDSGDRSGGTAGSARMPRGRDGPDTLLGTQVNSWRLEELLGSGSWARVYRATHAFLRKQCAIKILESRYAQDDHRSKRLLREAQALAEINHPNIVGVFDFGITPSGLPYLAMELVHGRTLRQLMQEQRVFAPERAAIIARDVALGLAEAHRRGLVHRDLKPPNVMIVTGADGSEHAKILDFGIARAAANDGHSTRLTSLEGLLGTPAYVAPEQIRAASNVGPAADLYSLGVILYEMLDGKRPFRGKVLELIDSHLRHPPPPLPGTSGLEPLAMTLLEKEPALRPPNAEAVVAAIEALGFTDRTSPGAAPGTRITEVTENRPARTVVLERSRRAMIWSVVLGGLVLMLVSAAGAYALLAPTEEAETSEPPAPLTAVPNNAQVGATARAPAEAPGSSGGADPTSTSTSSEIVTEAETELIEPVAAEAVGRGRPASSRPRPRPAQRDDSIDDLQSKLSAALRKRGLVAGDLDALEPGLWKAWRASVEGKDFAKAAAALPPLLAAVDRVAVDPALVQRKLARVNDRLIKAVGVLPEPKHRELEERYLKLLSQALPDLGAEQCRQLALEAASLDHEIAAAVKDKR